LLYLSLLASILLLFLVQFWFLRIISLFEYNNCVCKLLYTDAIYDMEDTNAYYEKLDFLLIILPFVAVQTFANYS
jgi:hypothetical protein